MLAEAKLSVVAFSRREKMGAKGGAVDWRRISDPVSDNTDGDCSIAHWICAAPIWVLPERFKILESYGARRVVVLSSTSRFTKNQSFDLEEQQLAKRIADAESQVQSWAENLGVEWVVLRPTLIYGLGRDKNITEMVRLIRRLGFFPLFGKAQGLRQPVHVDDVATACVSALRTPKVKNCAFNISGGETVTYREMVGRVFSALGWQPRLLTMPLWSFRLALVLVRLIPRYRHWSAAMAERMSRDMVFGNADASHAFGFKPRKFVLTKRDLP